MKVVYILAAWIFSFCCVFSQSQYFSIPEKNCSDAFGILPSWVTNPLNLKNIDKITFIGLISPSRYFVKELNSVGTGVILPMPLGIKSSLNIAYLGSKKFYYSQANFNFQRDVFEKFNFALSFGGNFFTIPSFGYKFHPNIDAFIEYFPYEFLSTSFKYKNLFGLNPLENNIAGFGCLFKFENFCALGFDCNIAFSLYTSYSFNLELLPYENLCLNFVVSTLPQTLNLSLGYKFDGFSFSLHFIYHNYLGLSQTIGFTNEF